LYALHFLSAPRLTHVPQAGLFSAVGAAFIVNIHSKLEPDLSKESVALLYDILSSLNAVAAALNRIIDPSDYPDIQEQDPGLVQSAAGFMYGSLLTSIMVAIIAVILKRLLTWYMQPVDGSMVIHCWDHQHRHNMFKKWTHYLSNQGLIFLLWLSPYCLAAGFSICWQLTVTPLQ